MSGYLDRVPAASALFLDIAHRNLTADQIARTKAFVDTESPRAEARGPDLRLSGLVTPGRVVLRLVCTEFEDIVEVATARLPAVAGLSRREVAERIVLREREAPTSLGGSMLAPHAELRSRPITDEHDGRASASSGCFDVQKARQRHDDGSDFRARNAARQHCSAHELRASPTRYVTRRRPRRPSGRNPPAFELRRSGAGRARRSDLTFALRAFRARSTGRHSLFSRAGLPCLSSSRIR